MIDYLGAFQRACMNRFTMTVPRRIAHMAGRKKGHGSDNGVFGRFRRFPSGNDAHDNTAVIPDDCGVVLILSRGWRKCLFYDYSVLPPDAGRRTDHLPRLFGHFLARLWFQEVYSSTDVQWGRLFDWG